jgi:dihydrofolate synthase/folylpolyglutamate synthase
VATSLVATTNSSGRAMPAAELAELAESVFGPDRVRLAERLDDAIELGVALADEADSGGDGSMAGLGGAGLLITGSVITAGEARLLLLGAQAGAGGATP